MKAFAVSAEAESLKPIKKHPAVLAAAGCFDAQGGGVSYSESAAQADLALIFSGHSRQTPQTGENHSRFTDFRKPNGSRILPRSFWEQKLKNFKIQKIFIYSIAHRKNSAKPTE